jgi:ADP-heptose:LPS heptosyltransferase
MTPAGKSGRSIRRVLVIFPGALGDLMCILPAIAAIARRHPGASVELMARSELARLAAGRTVVARAHSIDAREVGALFTDDASDSARRFFADFDRIYSFFAADDSRFRAHLAAATDGEVTFHPFRPGGGGHVSAAYLRAIGEADSPSDARLEPTADDLAAAASVLEESKCNSSNLIVIFPGSGSAAKNWPAAKFAALALCIGSEPVPASLPRSCPRSLDYARDASFGRDDRAGDAPNDKSGSPAGDALYDNGGLSAVATMPAKGSGILSPQRLQNDRDGRAAASKGATAVAVVLGPAEKAIEPIFREVGVPVLKDLDLPKVAAIARVAAAFVGNDSGVSHLAAAVGASGVVIFGPTDPARWRPMGPGGGEQITMLRREPIDSIEVGEVAGALLKFVALRRK